MWKEGGPAAFVLDVASSNGLGVVRSLAPLGIRVVGVDCDPDAPGLKSKYCKPLLAPDPEVDPEKLVGLLVEEGKEFSEKSVLYPTSDEHILFASRYRAQLSESFLLALPSEEVVESIVNKLWQYKLAEQVGIPYPDTRFPENLTEVEAVKDAIEYPALIKGFYSHLWAKRFRNKGFKVNDEGELVSRYREVFEAKLEALVQSVVVGPTENLVWVYSYFSKENEPLATFVTRKLRQYPNEFGLGTYMESIHENELAQTALKFFTGISYRGPGTIEFKLNNRDGKYRLIEVNARLGLHSIQPTLAGINFPLIQYLELSNQPITPVKDYVDGVKWLDITRDIQAFIQLRRKKNLSFVDWVKSLVGVQCHAFFAWDDFNPFLKNIEHRILRRGRRRH
jgi:predicted ATP-grasp superfamily ATP-dependent carboligase